MKGSADMKMSPKERFLAALAFEPTDRNVVYPLDITSWIMKEVNLSYDQLFALDDAGAEIFVKHHDLLKSDVLCAGNPIWQAWTSVFGCSADFSVPGSSIQVKEGINSVEELPDLTNEQIRDKFLQDKNVAAILKQIREIKKINGEARVLYTDLSGPLTAASTLIGPSKLMKLLIRKKPELYDLLDFSVRCIAVLTDLYYEAGTDFVQSCDPVGGGDMISLKMYKDIAVPAFIKYKENMENNKPFFIHICGKSGDRNETVRELGASAFSVDWMVDMKEMLEAADHKMVMIGNISPADQMLTGTPESVYEKASELLQAAFDNKGGLFLATGCDLPAGSPMENVHAMVKAAEDFAIEHN